MSEYDVYRRLILPSKVDPRARRVKGGGSSLFSLCHTVGSTACAAWSTYTGVDLPPCKYYGTVKQNDLAVGAPFAKLVQH